MTDYHRHDAWACESVVPLIPMLADFTAPNGGAAFTMAQLGDQWQRTLDRERKIDLVGRDLERRLYGISLRVQAGYYYPTLTWRESEYRAIIDNGGRAFTVCATQLREMVGPQYYLHVYVHDGDPPTMIDATCMGVETVADALECVTEPEYSGQILNTQDGNAFRWISRAGLDAHGLRYDYVRG